MATTLFRWEALNYNPVNVTAAGAAIAVRQTLSGTSSVAPVLRFSQGDVADFRDWLDRNYQNGAVRIRLCFAMVSATAGSLVMKATVMRLEGGVTDIDGDNFSGPTSSGTATVPPSSGVIQYLDILGGVATFNGTVPGEQFVLRLSRGAAGDGDTAAGDAEIIAIEGTETT